MDELSRTRVEEERDGVVLLLRTIADRLHALTVPEACMSLCRLASSVALLAHEAEQTIGPLHVSAHDHDKTDRPPMTTVVFVRRGAALDA